MLCKETTYRRFVSRHIAWICMLEEKQCTCSSITCARKISHIYSGASVTYVPPYFFSKFQQPFQMRFGVLNSEGIPGDGIGFEAEWTAIYFNLKLRLRQMKSLWVIPVGAEVDAFSPLTIYCLPPNSWDKRVGFIEIANLNTLLGNLINVYLYIGPSLSLVLLDTAMFPSNRVLMSHPWIELNSSRNVYFRT